MIFVNDLQSRVSINSNLINSAFQRVLDSSYFILGNEVNSFEEEFASYLNVNYCASVANGSDALELAMKSISIGINSKIATVANAGFYSTQAILNLSAKPIYIDVNENNYLMDLNRLEDALKKYTIDAVVITHLFGQSVDMSSVLKLKEKYNFFLIEDCAQSHGSKFKNQMTGSFGDLSTYSFYPTKNLGCLGDGGAVVSNDKKLIEKIKMLRQYGWKNKYISELPGGVNSRLDELQAAILRDFLPLLDDWNHKRREVAKRYFKGIVNDKVNLPSSEVDQSVFHLFVIKADDRNGLKDYLYKHNIASEIHYPIIDSEQKTVRENLKLNDYNDLTISKELSEKIITIPCYPELSNDKIDQIIGVINNW